MIVHIFIPNFNVGGAETVCVKIANHLSQTHDVIIYVNETVGVLRSSLNTSIQVRKLIYNRSILNFFQIRKILNENNDERFITFLTHINIIVLAASFSKKINGKIIVSERNNLDNDLSMQPWIKRYTQYFLIKFLYLRAKNIICVSKGVRLSVEKVLGRNSKIVHINNPVLSKNLDDLKLEPLPHQHQKFIQGRKFFLSVGRLEKQKNYPLLINSFNQISKKHGNYCLVILGSGSLLDELEKLVSKLGLTEKVIFPGFDENPFKWMHLADCFVLSSDYEGLPGALIQALAISKFIISTDCKDGPNEILKNGKYGHLIPVANEQKMTQAMCDFIDGKQSYVPFSERDLSRFETITNLTNYQEMICKS
jgi:glycosyltransferase involved in cell wall biosynthesis